VSAAPRAVPRPGHGEMTSALASPVDIATCNVPAEHLAPTPDGAHMRERPGRERRRVQLTTPPVAGPDARIFDLYFGAGYSTKTCAVYTGALLRARAGLAEFGATLDDVSAPVLRRYAESLPLTRASRATLRSALTSYWRLTGQTGPAHAILIPRRRPMRSRALDESVAQRLCAAAVGRGDRKGLAVAIGLYTGMRRSEIACLRWAEVGDGWISFIGKGNVERDVPIHPSLADLLERARNASEFVFPSPYGGAINPTTLWGWVKDVARDAGVGDVATHILRHTCLTTALEGTRDLRAVQELAGHASPETTAGYTRVSRARMVEVVGSLDYESTALA